MGLRLGDRRLRAVLAAERTLWLFALPPSHSYLLPPIFQDCGSACFTKSLYRIIMSSLILGCGDAARATWHLQKSNDGRRPPLAFVPAPLPPFPAVDWSPELRLAFDEALLALGRLDAVTTLLPNASLLLFSFIRKEAVLSSQIEGTQSSLSDLMLFEIDEQPGVPIEDTREVSRVIAALDKGLELLHGGLPICVRLLCESMATGSAGWPSSPKEYELRRPRLSLRRTSSSAWRTQTATG